MIGVGYESYQGYFVVGIDNKGHTLWHQYLLKNATAFGEGVDEEGNAYVLYQDDAQDFYIQKYDFAGDEVWLQKYSNGKIYDSTFLVTASGNIFLVGADAINQGELVLEELDRDGQVSWKSNVGNDADIYPVFLDRDSSGNVIVGIGKNGTDSIVRLDYEGKRQWSYQAPYGIVEIGTDSAGDVLICGDLFPEIPDQYNGFVGLLDGNGQYIWRTENLWRSGDLWATPTSCAIDRLGNAYVMIWHCGGQNAMGDCGDYYYDVSKYDVSGNLVWVATDQQKPIGIDNINTGEVYAAFGYNVALSPDLASPDDDATHDDDSSHSSGGGNSGCGC